MKTVMSETVTNVLNGVMVKITSWAQKAPVSMLLSNKQYSQCALDSVRVRLAENLSQRLRS